jgi:cation diffusion facilitator family transporter
VTAALGRLLPRDPASRAAALSVYMNGVLMVLKVSMGIVSGSVAVLSDGIDSGQDLIAATLVFASVRIGARPPDLAHPYGHGRVETLAASMQGFIIGAGGLFIVYQAVRRIADPPETIGTGLALAAMLIAAAANLALVQYTGRVARSTRSPAIASEARHLWTNVVQAGAVMLGLLIVAVTGEVAFDGAVALVLGGYLLLTAGRIFWGSVGDVLDTSLDSEEITRVRNAIWAEGDAVGGFHRLRTRRSGQVRHIDFHLLVAPHLTVKESHDIAERIEARIEHTWPGTVTTIHIEPDDGRYAEPGRPPARRGDDAADSPGHRPGAGL